MDSDAGSSVARRRRRCSAAFHLFVSLPLSFTMLLHEFLVCLGFLSFFAITSFGRCFRCRLYVLWFLCSPSPHLLTALVPDLTHDTCNSPHLTFSSQISDLKMTFLPTGKIHSDWCWCECVSRTSPLRALLSRPMSLDGSNPGSLQKPLRAAHTDDCSIFLSLFELNDQRLGAGSVKPLCLHHGNAGVGSSCLESMVVPLELMCSPIASSEHFSCSAHDGKFLQATKFMYADSQDLIHSPLIVFVLCSESSQGSEYASGRERSFSTIEFLQQLHLCSRCVNCNPDLMSHFPIGKLERLSLLDLSFLEKFISTSSHRGWERSFSPFSSFMERHLPSLSSYTESLTTSTNRFEFYTQFELLTLLVMLQISFNNHIGLYMTLHEA
ncbi:hypothetical protein DY000_02037128 [Brassica cretica]|uniref:CST complex subunit CTC1 n=1 Tax=Brassica cretica TaxID=69181 RepID=A0ABQ7BS16_BRACR|nr:hypothetical protein DY000_02037128 [Brassica cretica]